MSAEKMRERAMMMPTTTSGTTTGVVRRVGAVLGVSVLSSVGSRSLGDLITAYTLPFGDNPIDRGDVPVQASGMEGETRPALSLCVSLRFAPGGRIRHHAHSISHSPVPLLPVHSPHSRSLRIPRNEGDVEGDGGRSVLRYCAQFCASFPQPYCTSCRE
ncbi:hypothetical protein NMY22_g3675 [Coprinellus aureogranulatus]|nr:hypothetical protein NMY22_g3675 [Coprinellus aureogranulatus]